MSAADYARWVLGPGQAPPQAARALVRLVLRGGPMRRPELSCTWLDPTPGTHELSFQNEGGQTAVATRCIVSTGDGMHAVLVGDVPPGATVETRVPAAAADGGGPFVCVWSCRDAGGRTHAWSDAGKHKRFRRGQILSDEALVAAMEG